MSTLKLLYRHHVRYWRRGACNRKTLERTLRNQLRSFSKGSCPQSTDPAKCALPEPNTCVGPEETPKGRQQEIMPCIPDCLTGEPNVPPRGCLPWEKGVEICPTKGQPRRLESRCCEHLCEPYVGQGIIDKLKVSTCEYRRYKKCYDKTKNPKMCMEQKPSLDCPKKEYPMVHAVHKKYIPGCPLPLPRFEMPKNNEECDK